MSSFDHRQQSTRGLQVPGLVKQLSPVEQLPFPESSTGPVHTTQPLESGSTPAMVIPVQEPTSSPGITEPLTQQDSSPDIMQTLAFNSTRWVTRLLPELHPGTPPSNGATKATRQLTLIRGSGKKSPGTIRPPQGRNWVISSSILAIMLLTTLVAAFAVVPLATGNSFGFNPFQIGVNHVTNNQGNSNPDFIAQKAATATAFVRQDGYYQTNGGPVVTGSGGPNRFAYGQCTFWANDRYHALTGFWVPWLGNAYQWADGARASGWNVSSSPHVPSIIVLQPYVQGAGYFGHVAVVESINADGSVHTSNYNWYTNGGWATLSYWDFRPGPGVLFVWHG